MSTVKTEDFKKANENMLYRKTNFICELAASQPHCSISSGAPAHLIFLADGAPNRAQNCQEPGVNFMLGHMTRVNTLNVYNFVYKPQGTSTSYILRVGQSCQNCWYIAVRDMFLYFMFVNVPYVKTSAAKNDD